MKIAVFGNFGVQNIGDDLILISLLSEYQDHEVLVFCGCPRQVGDQFHVSAHPFFLAGFRSVLRFLWSGTFRRQIAAAHRALYSVDRVIIGGGGILVDRHFRAILLWWRQLRVISRAKKPFSFLSNSFELRHWWSRKLFENFFRQSEKITVRDSESLKFIQELGLSAQIVDDLSIEEVRKLGVRKLGSAKDGNVWNRQGKICLALCQWGLNQEKLDVIKRFVVKRQQQGYQVVGLAFQTEGDDDRKVYASLDANISVVTGLDNVLAELSRSEFLIGMRFHSIILALHYNIPLVALAYQQKVSNLMSDRGRSDYCISLNDLSMENLEKSFSQALGIQASGRIKCSEQEIWSLKPSS